MIYLIFILLTEGTAVGTTLNLRKLNSIKHGCKKYCRTNKRFLVFLILFGPAFILIFISTRGCDHKFKELEDYGKAAPYTFTDAQGKQFSSEDFEGKVVLINVLQALVLKIVLFLFGILTN